MDIKKTRILHRRYNAQGWSSRTLKQGEIGVLLSDDGKEILQVRVGMSNGADGEGSSFSNGLLLGVSDIDVEFVKQFSSRGDFPSLGKESVCYIAKDSNSIYRWDNQIVNYVLCSSQVLPGQGNGWWQEINGGNADLYDEFGKLNLGTSTQKDWSLSQQISKDINID